MVTISALEGWKPADLSTVADLLVQRRTTLIDLQDEIDAGNPPADWDGPASTGARQTQQRLKLRLIDMVAEVSTVTTSLDDAAEALGRAKTDLESWLSTAAGHGFSVQRDPIVVTPPDGEDEDDLPVTAQAIADGLSAALTAAAQADADLAAALRAANAGSVEGGEGTLRDARQMGDLQAMTPEEQVAYVKGYPDFPADYAAAISPEAQQLLAAEVSGDIEGQDVDAETVRLLGIFQGEEPFAHAVYSQVSPEEMSAVIQDFNTDLYPVPRGVEQPDEEQVELYRDFLTAAGVTLATYTNGTGAYAPPSDLSDTWFDAITADEAPGQAAGLTLLLRAGGQEVAYEPGFLSDLTGRVYDWERDQDGRVWGPRDGLDLTVNPFATGDDGFVFATDGLANLLGAMEHSPEAAQLFFHDGYPDGDMSEENDRLDYLLTERTFSGLDLSDEGDGLGAALRAAAVGDRAHEPLPGTDIPREEWSAGFTSDLFNLIADKSGTGDGWGPDDTWHIWPEMADDLGTIAAGYSGDVYDIIDGAPQDGPTHLAVTLEDLDKLLGEIGRGDKTGIETLSAAIMIEGNERINDVIVDWQADHPGEPLTMEALADSGLGLALQGRGSVNGEVLGHILNESVLVDLEDEELAATRAAYVSKAIDIAGGFIPGAGSVLGAGASHFAESAYDIATGEGIDLLKSAVEGTAVATADEYVQQSRDTTATALEYNVLNQLIRNGYLGDQYPGVDGPTVDHTPAIPPSLLVDGPNGTQVVNPDLYDADGVDTIGDEGDYTDAEIRQMREDWNRWMNNHPVRDIVEGITGQAQDGFDRAVNEGP